VVCRCGNGHEFEADEAEERGYRCWDGARIVCPANNERLRPVLRRDFSSTHVSQLNDRLEELGFRVGQGAEFDEFTEVAIVNLQKAHRLKPDGIVGEKTWQVIDRLKAGSIEDKLFETILEVPYLSQRDNQHHPNGTCNVTCLAMVLSYFGVRPRRELEQLEDELFNVLWSDEGRAYFRKNFPDAERQNFNPQNVHGMLTWLAKKYGMKARFTMRARWSELRQELSAERPVIVTGRFTASGHIVLLVGVTSGGDFVVHDPFGDWNRAYRPPHDGAFRIYQADALDEVLKQAPDEKWAHFIAAT
jgi:uncharacterized protein YvpB